MIALSRRRTARDAAERAYRRVVEHARDPAFFTVFGVPDTLDGRYEMICLLAFLYLRRLKSERPHSAALCQSFFDIMFAEMDRALRELGTGDLSVGREVKRMAQGFYGRIRAYERGLDQAGPALAAALARNAFGTSAKPAEDSLRLAGWVRTAADALAAQQTGALCLGEIWFPPPATAFGDLETIPGSRRA